MKAIFSATILRGKCEIRALFYRRFLFLSHMIIWHMLIACWKTQATSTHLKYVILIFHCKVVTRRHLNVTPSVRWLSCCFLPFYSRFPSKLHHSGNAVFPLSVYLTALHYCAGVANVTFFCLSTNSHRLAHTHNVHSLQLHCPRVCHSGTDTGTVATGVDLV